MSKLLRPPEKCLVGRRSSVGGGGGSLSAIIGLAIIGNFRWWTSTTSTYVHGAVGLSSSNRGRGATFEIPGLFSHEKGTFPKEWYLW